MVISEIMKRNRTLLAIIAICIAAILLIVTVLKWGAAGSSEKDVAGLVEIETQVAGATETETQVAGATETETQVAGSTVIETDVAGTNSSDISIGATSIAKWKGDKMGAFSMSLDDSMISQADVAVPAMVERGIAGTWFINPGKSHYQQRQEVWEQTIPATDHELANHTIHHEGAGSFEEAEYEIGESARLIWSLRSPDASKLLSFDSGGATNWNITQDEWQILIEKYHLIFRTNSRSTTNANAAEMIGHAQEALDQGSWVSIHFHGIGGGWLPVETQDFLQFLDYLVTVQENLWIGTYGSVHKYIEERNSAQISVLEASDDLIRLDVTSDMPPELYDEPLTLITEVPQHWTSCEVSQAGQTKLYEVLDGIVQYEAIPGLGEITLTLGS